MPVHEAHHRLQSDFHQTVAADAARASQLTREFATWLSDRVPIDEERRADVKLAVYEAISNCAEHAYAATRPGGAMTVHAHYDPTRLMARICILDQGSWLDAHEHDRPRSRGRGLMLMRALADDVTVDGRPDGTTVCLHFHECQPAPLRPPTSVTQQVTELGA